MLHPPLPYLPAVPRCERGFTATATRDRCACSACKVHRTVRATDQARVAAAQDACTRWAPASTHKRKRNGNRAGRRKAALKATALRRRAVRAALRRALWIPFRYRSERHPFDLRSSLRRLCASVKGKLKVVAVYGAGQHANPPRGARLLARAPMSDDRYAGTGASVAGQHAIQAAEDSAAVSALGSDTAARYQRNAAYRARMLAK